MLYVRLRVAREFVCQELKLSGKGRTAGWSRELVGTVTAVERGSVKVEWDGTCIEDEMEPRELVSTGEFAAERRNAVGVMLADETVVESLAAAVLNSHHGCIQ